MTEYENVPAEEAETKESAAERAVLVSVPTVEDEDCRVSLCELARLVDTAGGEVFATLVQARPTPDVRTCIGKGKVEELREICKRNDIALVVFDCDLSPSQIRNLEEALEGEKKDGEDAPQEEDPPRVIDRSMLILDIFAAHAKSGEGKLQVMLAQLQYTIPRLSGKGTELSRLGGGIGTRGPGESKLESDRRHLKRRIVALQEEIARMEFNRATQRKQRDRSGLTRIAIAGYTNAGKSTLLNRLTDAGILAEDKLFATLDPTTRKFTMPDGTDVLLTDTVGFIRNLPHHLISAFRSTLDEVAYADILLVMIDASDPEYRSQLDVTEQLLGELGAPADRVLYALNKIDQCPDPGILSVGFGKNVVRISAVTGQGIDDLLSALSKLIRAGKHTVTLRFSHKDQKLAAQLYDVAAVRAVSYDDNGTVMVAEVDEATLGRYAAYIEDRIN